MNTPSTIIEPEALACGLLSDYLLVDVGKLARYEHDHIPGAVHLSPSELVMGTGPLPRQLPPLERIGQALEAIGFHPQRPTVIYDDEGGGWAGRLFWTLDLLGFSNHRYLNGGLLAWSRENHVLKNPVQSPTQAAASLEVSLKNPQLRASRSFVLEHLNDPNVTLWDARSAKEYHEGHIPGAVHFEYSQGMDPEHHLRIRHDLAERLQQVGIIPEKKTIVYCGAHHRSAFAYMAATTIGFTQISAYEGAWMEWSQHADSPVAR